MITRKTTFTIGYILSACLIPMLSGQGGIGQGLLDPNSFSSVSGMMSNLGPSITEHLDFPTSNAHVNAQNWADSQGTQSQAHRHGETTVHDPHHGHSHGPGHQEIDHSTHEHVGGAMSISNFVEANLPSGQTPTREEALELRRQQLWDLRNGVSITSGQTGQQPTGTHHGHSHTRDSNPVNHQLGGHTDHSHVGPPTDTMTNPSDPFSPNLTPAERRERRRRQRRLNRLNDASGPGDTGAEQGNQHLSRQEQNRQRRLQRRWERRERRRQQRLGQGSADPNDTLRTGAQNQHDRRQGRNNQRWNQRGRKRWNRNNRNPNNVGPVDQHVTGLDGTNLVDTADPSSLLPQEQTQLSAAAQEWLEREKARLLAVEKAKKAEKKANKMAAKRKAEKAAEAARLLEMQKAVEAKKLKAAAKRKAREMEAFRQNQQQERIAEEMRAKILAAEQAAEKARRLQRQIAEEAERQRQEQERLQAQHLADERARHEAEHRAREKAIERARLAELERLKHTMTTVNPAPVVHVQNRRRRRRRRILKGLKRIFGKK